MYVVEYINSCGVLKSLFEINCRKVIKPTTKFKNAQFAKLIKR